MLPPFFAQMIERGWLGDKRGQGFYKTRRQRRQKEIQALDLNTLEYHAVARKRASRPSTGAATSRTCPQRLRAWWRLTDRAGTFLWKLFSDLLLYSASMVPEISDRIVEIDRAMRWGYANSARPVRTVGRAGRRRYRRAHAQGRQRAYPGERRADARSGAKSFYEARRSRPPPASRVLRLCWPTLTSGSKTAPASLC